MTTILINKLKAYFSATKELPGIEAQLLMSPSIRKDLIENKMETTYQKACVLLLLFLQDNKIHLTFIKRALNGDVHGGQMAFAGGKQEKTDQSDIDTALREANEEIGINREDVEIIGLLSKLYVPISNFVVQPIIGFIAYSPQFIPFKSEVEKIVTINIDEILRPEIISTKTMTYPNITFEAPFYNIGEHVWGATAMILSEFVSILNDIKTLPTA